MIMKKNLFVFLLCILIHQVSFAQTAKYEQLSKVATTKFLTKQEIGKFLITMVKILLPIVMLIQTNCN